MAKGPEALTNGQDGLGGRLTYESSNNRFSKIASKRRKFGKRNVVCALKKLHKFKKKHQKKINMIRKRAEKDNDEIMNVWYEASSLAHSFLEDDFVEKAKKDLRDIYIPNT